MHIFMFAYRFTEQRRRNRGKGVAKTRLRRGEAALFPRDLARLPLQLGQVDLLVVQREGERAPEDLFHLARQREGKKGVAIECLVREFYGGVGGRGFGGQSSNILVQYREIIVTSPV